MEELRLQLENSPKPIEFQGYKCSVRTDEYVHNLVNGNRSIAVILVDVDTDEDLFFATANMPHEHLDDGEVIIKDYSENEGMLHTLIMAKIISVPERYTKTGMMPVCKLRISTTHDKNGQADNNCKKG